MNSNRRGNAYDPDSPREGEADDRDPEIDPVTGGPQKDHILVCQACNGLGYLTLYSTPYGKDWGVVAEAIPCACRYPKVARDLGEPAEYTRRRIIQHARRYLSERDLEYPAPPKLPPAEDE